MKMTPAHYTCYRTAEKPAIDGKAEGRVWTTAPKSERFVDMVTGEPGLYDTRAAALWDDQFLYIAFWVEEPFVKARLRERGSIIFTENDVEVFIDGEDCYYELEMNALGTIYEAFFVWHDAYRRGSRFDIPEFDLVSRDAFSFAGDDDRCPAAFWRGRHPRGKRWAFLDWDFPGLMTAVHVDGTINDSTTLDRGWSAELAFPWTGFGALSGSRPIPPKDGDVWRMFFGRFEKIEPSGVELKPHPAWVWSPHGEYDTHRPEAFPYIHFSEKLLDEQLRAERG